MWAFLLQVFWDTSWDTFKQRLLYRPANALPASTVPSNNGIVRGFHYLSDMSARRLTASVLLVRLDADKESR
jgi:hypothetical protein